MGRRAIKLPRWGWRLPAAFLRGEAAVLPFAADSFDAVLSECTLCLFGGREAFLREAHRVLRPGGWLLLSDVTLERPRASFACAAGFAACLGEAVPRSRLQAVVGAAGFEGEVEDRSEELAVMWGALASRVDLGAIARDFGPVLAAFGVEDAPRLVSDLEDALRKGELGYVALVARKV